MARTFLTPIVLTPAASGYASVLLTQGVAPGSVPDGSLWSTTSGIFYQHGSVARNLLNSTPGGATTQAQFNDAGSLAGTANWTYTKDIPETTTGPVGASWAAGSFAGTSIGSGGVMAIAGNSSRMVAALAYVASNPTISVVSTNGGSTWTNSGGFGTQGTAYTMVWTGTYFVAGGGFGNGSSRMWYSVDSTTWTDVGTGASYQSSEAWSHIAAGTGTLAGTLLARGGAWFIRSTDHGVTWAVVTPPANWNANCRIVCANNEFIMYAGTYCWASPTGATGSWTVRTSTATSFFMNDLDYNPTTGVLIGTSSGQTGVSNSVIKSTDAGATWSFLTLPNAGNRSAMKFIAGTWVISGSGSSVAKVWRSTDDGVNWSELTVVASNVNLNRMGWSPTKGISIFAYNTSAPSIYVASDSYQARVPGYVYINNGNTLAIQPWATPAAPLPGQIIIDSTGGANALRWYDGAAWKTAGTGSVGTTGSPVAADMSFFSAPTTVTNAAGAIAGTTATVQSLAGAGQFNLAAGTYTTSVLAQALSVTASTTATLSAVVRQSAITGVITATNSTSAATNVVAGVIGIVQGTPTAGFAGEYIGLYGYSSRLTDAGAVASTSTYTGMKAVVDFTTLLASAVAATSLYGVRAVPIARHTANSGGTTITNMYGLAAESQIIKSGTGGVTLTITQYCGLYLPAPAISGTGNVTFGARHGINQTDTVATNVFAGSAHAFGTLTTSTGAINHLGTGGVRTIQAATQDGVVVLGRAGGTTSYMATLTPTTLSGNRTLTLPDVTGTLVTGTGTNTYVAFWNGTNTVSSSSSLTWNGTTLAVTGSISASVISGTATQLLGATAGNVLAALTVGSGLSLTAGTLSAAGGTPAGTNTQVQYNSAGAFAASSDFTFVEHTPPSYSGAGTSWSAGSGTAFSTGIQSAAGNGARILVVQSDGATTKISSSTDGGATWSTSASISGYYTAIAWSGTYFILFSDDLVKYSTDGTTWTTAAGSFSSAYLRQFCVGTGTLAGTILAWGPNAVMQRSTDGGLSWNTVTFPAAIDTHIAMACGGNEFVAYRDTACWASSTGASGSWSSRTSSSPNKLIKSMATDGAGRFIGVKSSNVANDIFYTSTDAGATWTAQTSAGGSEMNTISFVADVWLAVGNNGTVFRSTDGTTWNSSTVGSGWNWLLVAHAPGQGIGLFEQSGVAIWTSSDGYIAMVPGSVALANVNFSVTGSVTVSTLTGTCTQVLGATAANTLAALTIGSGLSLSAGTLSVTGGVVTWTVITAVGPTLAVAGNGYILDATSNAVTLNLPASPTVGATVYISASNVTNTVTIGRNGNNLLGQAADFTMTTAGDGLQLVYTGATFGWTSSTEIASTVLPTLPGGLNTQVQFNNAGAFAGSANMTWDGTTFTASALKSTASIEVASAGYMYLGTPNSVGSWRVGRSGNDLVMERYDSASYVLKQTILA